jgi:ABC-type Mn2+/Zn2+ transport system ATPase subunit
MKTPLAAEQEAVIDVRHLDVRLGGRAVLEDVNVRVRRGQLVAVIGPNGSGKTTLLRALLGLQAPTAGEIRLFGTPDRAAVLNRIGYVPQRLALERGFVLSVREFLATARRETRHWLWRRHQRTDAALLGALPELGLHPLLDLPLAGLSGGQLQRVLIAFSLLRRPELLLLDEPTTGIDTPGEATFYELTRQIHDQFGVTIVLVSHDLSMVYRHADWVFALNRVVCCEGTPEQVMNAESLKQAYGIHLAPYHHAHNGHAH